MNEFIQKSMLVFQDPALRKRIGFTVLMLVAFRALAAIPIPGVDAANLAKLLSSSQLFGFLNIFSGGGLSNLSIVMLGVGPFITASIIVQLLTMIFPSWKALMHDEGEAGRIKLSQYSRVLGAPLAIIQAIGFLILLQSQAVLPHITIAAFSINVIVITAGSILLMWLGELISEFGIGNGVSLIIFAGIVSRLPRDLVQFSAQYNPANLPFYLGVLVVAVLAVAGVVYVTEAERSVPVTYAKQVRGNKVYGGSSTYLPLRLNQSGVIPIIFALSILLFPQIIFGAIGNLAGHPTIAGLSKAISGWLTPPSWPYGILYFLMVVLFTYFYTAVTFDPKLISENLQRTGAFIPGVRPGDHTEQHLGNIVTRITLVGAVFLGVVAILPLVIQTFSPDNSQTLAIGGTGLLIVVSVVIDLLKKVDAQVAMREY
ncbi:MAG: preprotein translocase subunit SecY [Patescibacteria group bacterium]|nr:preprotein translocase subunit SecY [Patescibacteria group bacterium]MDE1941055.1 preprotein translocase subunit SecY [Patescibacteria group bacterium]MDE1966524.1 preprotein translocase subunit SecY [Patescibacteria group bacterium]